ncbi:MAG: hypothetical protein L0191_19810, partial [Acidobacteria bacterium]|nr:hypothetical protein [Acidobacteriota bacterium]
PALPLPRSSPSPLSLTRQASAMASHGQGHAPVHSPLKVAAVEMAAETVVEMLEVVVEVTVEVMTAEMAAPRCVMASIPSKAALHDAGDPAVARVGAHSVGADVALLFEPAVERGASLSAWAPIRSAMV